MRIVQIVLIGLSCLLLHSCIEGDEDIWIDADGSARVKAVYRVPGVLFSASDAEELKTNIAEEVENEKHLKLITNRVEKINGHRVITIEIETDDALALEGALAEHHPGVTPSKADKMLHAIMGRITIQQDGLSAEINREVDLSPLLDEHLGKKSAAMLGDSEFRYTVHFPDAVESSNAHVVENGGRTLKWAYKLRECANKPIVLNVVAKASLPWWVYGAGVIVVAVLCWGGWWIVKGGGRLRAAAT